MMDLVIRNGEVITSEGSIGTMDIGIVNGIIKQIGGELVGTEELDASGMFVLPGGVDAHVHLSYPLEEDPGWVDDFTSGSAAALAGGVTTLGNMCFPLPGEKPLETLKREAAIAMRQTMADLFLHPVFIDFTPEALEDIPRLLDSGCNTIKIFTVMPNFDSQLVSITESIRTAGRQDMLSMIHCEDYALIQDATAGLLAQGKRSLRYYPESRPVISEVIATQRAVSLAEATGSPIYVVHLSSERALSVCVEAQSRGVPVFVETRPFYLHLKQERFEEEDGAKYVGQPPLRARSDVEALWSGIGLGMIHTVCTDHAPWSLAAKLDPAHTIDNLRPGAENLQTMVPMLYSEGVRTDRISLGRFVEITSTNSAKLFGLYPRKGEIAVGSDADLVIFDPNLERTIEGGMLKSNADYSVYEGWEVMGWPVITIRRGEIVFRDDEVLAQPGSGELVSRGPVQSL